LTQSVFVGGLFIGVLSALPIVNVANCCCLWILLGGAIAAFLSRQEGPGPIDLLTGARVGFRAGIVGAVVWLVCSVAIDAVVAPLQQRFADLVLNNATDMPGDVRAWLDGASDNASTPARLMLGFLFQLGVATPFAALGGLLGAAMITRAAGRHVQP